MFYHKIKEALTIGKEKKDLKDMAHFFGITTKNILNKRSLHRKKDLSKSSSDYEKKFGNVYEKDMIYAYTQADEIMKEYDDRVIQLTHMSNEELANWIRDLGVEIEEIILVRK